MCTLDINALTELTEFMSCPPSERVKFVMFLLPMSTKNNSGDGVHMAA